MFAPLDTKTVYSFMDSLIDLKSYVQKAKDLGYSHVGIADKDNLYAAYHFAVEAKKEGLQPVLGIELTFHQDDEIFSVLLLALNTQGYKNLLKLSTLKMSDGLILEDLSNYQQGLAILVPYFAGLENLQLPFDYYIGVSLDSPQQVYSKPILPLQTVRYFSEEERESLQVLHAISDNLPLKDVHPPKAHQQLYPRIEMEQLFQERFPESLENLERVLNSVSYQFDHELKLPRFNRDKEAVVELRERAEAGLKEKGLFNTAYQERLDKELGIIHKMGFDDYFLIVWDLLRFGRSRHYYMGMGRGSAAGSLVAFALDITGIDPIKNNLLFERFLNEERYSMPDIDIDLPDVYRTEFLRYVRDRYGSRHSAQIVTFSTFGAKQAIRDVFKRFGAAEYELTNITRKISFRDDLSSAYEKNMSFRQIINSKLEYQKAFTIAKRIEGLPRQTSIHAAGIVMSDDDLTDHIPLKAGEDMMITQYDAGAVEANGLLKMDFLGLRNLTFVQRMAEKLAEEQGVQLDIKSIDLEDPDTLALFAAGKTKGIFQFEQAGAINLLKRIKPAKFEEIVATTSLNRPGASDYTENFINRKYGKEAVDLIDPLVAPILEGTYGIMLYQEQVMQIAQVFAGFTLGKADLLRRAMSKKNQAEMQKMEADFLQGAKDLGRNPSTAKELFERMAKFAGYGFNRSHAFAYSALAFQLAYFKAHYPSIFYDVMLNYSSADYITDALQTDFTVGTLSINTVPYRDKISDGIIYMGLKNLKGFPRELAYWIIEQRPFKSIEDFLTRLSENYQKVDYILPLIQIGLFDQFEPNRRKIEENLESLFTFVHELGSLFAESSYNWVQAEDYTASQKYNLEVALLGVGISPHPLVSLAKDLKGSYSPFEELIANSQTKVLGQIESVRVIRTKSKGEQMAFVSLTDTKQKLDVTVFPEAYRQWKAYLKEGEIYYITGRVQERDGHLQLVLQSLEPVSQEKFWIQLADHAHDQEIAQILQAYPGSIPVVLHYQDTNQTMQSQQLFVAKSEKLQKELTNFVMKTIYH
ncbi:DNA polymerase III subunit alpha [Streptococcus tangpeifui]|uniref:DNA polymerase III subunit alpha n=1 Tax=Streptococcus tangpeifui TaxID=2709400 RepID=UPI0013EE0B49|nr:DNA polymerase III subunit alpha [Streptococcus sp. ZJ373]